MLRRLARKYQSLTLQHRLSLQVTAALLVVFVILGLLGHYAVREDQSDILRDRLVFARTTASYLDNELREQLRAMSALAGDMARDLAEGRGPANWSDRLLQYLEPFTVHVVFLNTRQQVVWASPGDADLTRTVVDSARGSLLLSGEHWISPVYPLDTRGTAAVSLVIPVQGSDGAAIGSLIAAINPMHAHFNQFLISASRLGNTVQAELVDGGGNVVSASRSGLVLRPAAGGSQLLTWLRQHTTQVQTLASDQGGGDRRIVAFVPLELANWGLVVSGSEVEAFAVDHAWTLATTLVGGLSLLAALIFIWLAVRSVTRPIEALTGAARRISTGDLTMPVPPMGQGEVRLLAEAFDRMRRRLAESYRDLAVRTNQYEATIRSMADALITMDTDCRITSVNPAAEALLGRPARELLGLHCCQALAGTGTAGEFCQACPMQDARTAATTCTLVLRGDSGENRTVALARSLILTEKGEPAGVVQVMRDISAEADLARLKDEFISTVFHELRTPLGFIKGYTTTLLRKDTVWNPRDIRRFLRIIDQASDDLEEYINNLLDVSKIGAGVLRISPQPTSLPNLARRVVQRFRPRCRGHQLVCDFPRVFPLVMADPRRLDQILHNLIDNAVKYSPDGGAIRISGHWRGEEAVVSVSDEGPGIPLRERELVFERFYRGHAAVPGGPAGSGLGLAICRGVVEAHGGHIWVESGHNRGTCISFSLPLYHQVEEEGQAQ